MQYLQRLDDLNPKNRTFVLNNNENKIEFFNYTGETFYNDGDDKKINMADGRYFLRKGFVQTIRDYDENIVKPLLVDQNGEDYFPSSQDNIISLIHKNEIGIKGFAYSPRATKEEKDAEFEKIVTAFVEVSKRPEFSDEKNRFCIRNGFFEAIYNNGGDGNIGTLEILKNLKLDTSKLEQAELDKHIEQRKQEIRERLSKRHDEDKVSGAVVADKIAEAQISGVIDEPVTPKKGKKLSDGIKRKIISNGRLSR